MDIKEALTRDLREKCPACEGKGSGRDLVRIWRCSTCEGSGKVTIPQIDLIKIVNALRRELDKISDIVFSECDVVTQLLSRESLMIDS